MKNKTHIMVDIESLGKSDNATIFQIAAATFDIASGEVKNTIDLKLDIETVKNLRVDGDTLKWWLNTNKKLLTELLNEGDESELGMVQRFQNWVAAQGNIEDVTLWGNGIIFDNAKIQQKMNGLGVRYPIHYKNDRDVRTILALASDKSGLSEKEIKDSVLDENEVEHDALDDVMYQIRLVCYCYSLLMETVGEEEETLSASTIQEIETDGWIFRLGDVFSSPYQSSHFKITKIELEGNDEPEDAMICGHRVEPENHSQRISFGEEECHRAWHFNDSWSPDKSV